MNKSDTNVYGYVNGKPVYNRDEFIFASRHFGAITIDEELLEYAEKVTGRWSQAGHCQSFAGFYLSDYALSEPYRSLTKSEFARLKELQAEAQAKAKRREAELEWKLIDTVYYADNSVEEIYENKHGERKTVMVVQPHGDVC